MSGRWGQWRKLIGDVTRPDLLDVGKKALAYLANQRQLSGVKTLSLRQELPDGSIVLARFIGDMPVIDILPGPGGARERIAVPMLYGFVTKPRLFGAVIDPFPVDITNGENAYGEKAHTILTDVKRNDEEPTWQRYFFDESFQVDPPGGLYERLFPDGLLDCGNVDWRDGNDRLAVTWIGPPGRSVGIGHSDYVFYNGKKILSLSVIDTLRAVNCACLKVIGADLWLYVLATPFANQIRSVKLYRAKLRPRPGVQWEPHTALLCPLVDDVVADDIETVYTLDHTATIEQAYACTQGAFNQAATEVRVVQLSFSAGDYIHSDELRIDFTDPDDIIESVTRRTVRVTDTTTFGPQTYQANVNELYTDDSSSWVSDTPFPGFYPYTEHQTLVPTRSLGRGSGPATGDPNYRGVIGIGGSTTRTTARTGTSLTYSVDFKANVPVRLYWQPTENSGSGSYTRTFSNNHTSTGEREYLHTGGPGSGYTSLDLEQHFVFNFTEIASSSGAAIGGKVWVEVEGEAPWLVLETQSSESYSSSTTDERSQDWHVTATPASPEFGFINADTVEQAEVHIDRLSTSTIESHTEIVALWWLDMRSDSATYSTVVGDRDVTTTTTTTGDYTSTDLVLWGGNVPTNATCDVSAVTTGGYSLVYTLHVLFGGVEVDSTTWTRTVDVGDTANSTPSLASEPNWSASGSEFPSPSGEGMSAPDGGGTPTLYASYTKADSLTRRAALIGSSPTDPSGVLDLMVTGSNTASPAVTTSEGAFPDYDRVAMANTVTNGAIDDGTWALTFTEAGPRSWLERKPDSDIRTNAWNLDLPKGWGTWIAYRGRWAFSIPWPGTDMTIATWHDGITLEDTPRTLFELTGERDDPAPPDLYGTMWPLSQCAPRLPAGITAENLKELLQ